MFRRLIPLTALMALVALPSAARPDEKAGPKAPGLVLRLASLDDLLADVRYLGDLVGRGEEAKQAEGFLKAKAGEKGLEGVDTKRPMALYGTFGPAGIDSTAVVVIPIADEKAFLALLANLDVKADKGDDGVYSVNSDKIPVPIYFRFADKHVYATAQSKDALDKDKLLAPAAVLGEGRPGLLALALRIDQIPQNLRDLAAGQVKQQVENAKKQEQPNETPAQKTLREALMDESVRQTTALLRDGAELSLRLDIDRKAGELSAEVSLGAKAGSPLAADIADLGKTKSTVAGIVGANSAMSALFHYALPAKARQALDSVVEEALAKFVKEEKDKARREQGWKLFKALAPTLKSGELDVAVDLRGPVGNGLFTMVGALKLTDGAAVEKALRDAVAAMPAEQRKMIALDADKAGEVAIHRLTLPKGEDDGYRKAFGDGPPYVAVRADAAFVALGDGALDALKEALKAQPMTAAPLRFEASLAHLAKTMAKDQPRAPQAAEKAFAEKGSDTIRVSFEGGKTVKLRGVMKAQVLRFFHLMEPQAAP